MSAPKIQGWCPGALRPMLSGDGLVVRLRPRGGRLTQVQMTGIADLAARHGNGLIDLSTRANVQIRGVGEASHPALIDGLGALGLIDDTLAVETRRNIVVQPFWAEGDDTRTVAAGLERALIAADAPATPGKFGHAVDCGAGPVLSATAADIRIERDEHGLIVRPDGAATAARATAQTAPALALELARWFLASGGAPAGRGRMAAHLARGAVLPEAFRAVQVGPRAAAAPPLPGPVPPGCLVAFEFGQMSAETLALLAGTGPIRITPWRMLLIEGRAAPPAIPGVISGPGNPLLNVYACTGAPGCPQAHVATRALARRLAPALSGGATLHVCGCAKGCAHPGAAALTLVGEPGGTLALIRDGTAADPPRRRGLNPEALVPDTLTEAPDAPQL